ncbi:hypothetical protein, partial [Flavobacterium sp.]|uniref:hypothetical protein n=1 Tax=Flavobacterium sp. TaxID=239 RepID=UPI004047555F
RMKCFVIFVMACCWCNATESKPQNVMGKLRKQKTRWSAKAKGLTTQRDRKDKQKSGDQRPLKNGAKPKSQMSREN